MADANIIQPTFAAGELAPDLYSRVDLAKYHTGAAVMRNFFVNYKGGASTRPGTQFIGFPNTPTQPVRIHRFIFSSFQTYILVFSDFSLQVIANNGSGNAYPNSAPSGFLPGLVVSTPYPASALRGLKFSQSADIMNITHVSFPRMILSRFSDTNWTLTQAITGATIYQPAGLSISITGLPTGSTDPQQTTYMYAVTAVDSNGQESNPASYIYVTGIDISSTLGSVTVSWTINPAAQYYKVYKAVPTSGNVIPSYGQQVGYIGFTYGASFTDSNIIPDFTQGPPAHSDPFSPSQITGYTITNGGSGYNNESTVINPPPFNPLGPQSQPTIFPLFSTNVVNGVGSIVGLFIANPGDNLTGTNITASGDGGSGFAATAIIGPASNDAGVSAYFQQRLVLATTPSNPVTIYGSKSGFYNNFDKSNPILDSDAFTFTLAVQEVNKIQWMLSAPSGLVLFTDSGVELLTGGSTAAINPAAVTPASAVVSPITNFGANNTCEPIKIIYDILYVQSEGTIVRVLTYNPFFYNVYAGPDITLLSTHLFYPNTLVNWAYQDVPFKCIWAVRSDGVLLSCTYLKEQEITGWARHDSPGAIFESVAVIPEGASDAVYFVVNRNGTRCIERLTERNYTSGVTSAWCLDCALSYSGPPTTTISGLSYLTSVSSGPFWALADGVPYGPLTIVGDMTTLPVAASNVVVGINFQCQLQTLYLDVGGEGRIQGQRKKIAAMSTRVKDTAGLKMGTTFGTVRPFIPGISSTDPVVALPPAPPGLFVGDMRMIMDPAYQVVGCVCIQQDLPLPATVLGVIPEVVMGA